MPVHPIRLFPDKVLSTPCKPVSVTHSSTSNIVRDLFDSLYDSPGVGLAAPQIGISKQISVIDVGRARKNKNFSGSYQGKIILINPKLLSYSGLQTPREGCLSVPDFLGNVRRYKNVVVHTLNLENKISIIKASGFEALALQHEIDHLDGKLFLDRVSNLKTDIFRRKSY